MKLPVCLIALLFHCEVIMAQTPFINLAQASIHLLNEKDISKNISAIIIDGDHEIIVGNPNAIYQIGSVTKGLLSFLIQHSIDQKKLNLDALVRTYLKTGNKSVDDLKIKDLVTHHSGIARIPDNLPGPSGNPYQGSSSQGLLDFLRRQHNEPGKYAYSNTATAFMGFILETIWAQSIDDLWNDLVKQPLNLTVSDFSTEQVIQGHSDWFNPTETWDLGAFKAAGGLRSNADELSTIVKKLFFSNKIPSTPIVNFDDYSIGIYWGILPKGQLVHAGQTYGHSSFLGVDIHKKQALIVLSDTAIDLNPFIDVFEGKKANFPEDGFLKRTYKKLIAR
jgi:CubicO group peptidase (beta-lactamase class C family)